MRARLAEGSAQSVKGVVRQLDEGQVRKDERGREAVVADVSVSCVKIGDE